MTSGPNEDVRGTPPLVPVGERVAVIRERLERKVSVACVKRLAEYGSRVRYARGAGRYDQEIREKHGGKGSYVHGPFDSVN